MKKILSFLCISLISFSFGCTKNDSKHIANQGDVIEVNESDNNIQVSKEMNFLEESSNIADTSTPFTQFKAFIPNKKNSDDLIIKDEKLLYLKVIKNSSKISGRLSFENNTEKTMEIQSLFFQGNQIAKIKLSDENNYYNAIKYKIAPFSSATINIDIKIDKNGKEELTFLPLDLTAPDEFYNGANSAISRFYLNLDEKSEKKLSFEKHSFRLDQKEIENISNIFPIPYWVDENKENINEKYKNGKVYLEKKISGLKLVKIPYKTEIDILLIDEFGNISILEEKVKIAKNMETYIPIKSDVIKEIYSNKNKQFLLLLNNRGEEIFTDLAALDIDKKPFPTTYSSIIQFYKNIEEEN